MKYIFIIILALLSYKECWSCKCALIKRDSSVSEGLRYSDIVFYGELLKYDTLKLTFQFRILELFKGKYNQSIVNGRVSSSCSILPVDGGFWIVYSRFNEDSTISISSCGPSVSLRNPQGLLPPPPPPPPPPPIKNTKSNYEMYYLEAKIHFLEIRLKGLSDWFNDLEKLREYKKEHSVIKKEVDVRNIAILFLALLNIGLLVVFIIKNRK